MIDWISSWPEASCLIILLVVAIWSFFMDNSDFDLLRHYSSFYEDFLKSIKEN